MRIKWRNILLLLVTVGAIAGGTVVLLKGDVVLAKVKEGNIPGIPELASRLPGDRADLATPDAPSAPVAAGEPIIHGGVSWFSTPAPTPTRPAIRIAQPEEMATVNTDVLNMRAGPGTGHDVLGTAERDDELEILAKNADGTWIQVIIPDGTEAWVYLDLVTVKEGALDRVPVAE